MFKWLCLGLAAAAVTVLFWLVNDLRRDLEQLSRALSRDLPAILENTKKSSQTLAALAEDARHLRDLATMTARDRTIVQYADSVLDLVQASGGRIGLRRMGGGLKDPVPAEEWVAGARKEALLQLLRVKSRTELLRRLGSNLLGSKWHIQVGEAPPVPLEEWLKSNHPETRQVLEAEDKAAKAAKRK